MVENVLDLSGKKRGKEKKLRPLKSVHPSQIRENPLWEAWCLFAADCCSVIFFRVRFRLGMLLWWRFSSLICSSFSDFSLQLLLLQLYIPLTPFSFLPLSRNRPSAHGTIHRVSLLIVWNMAGIFQATSEDLWRGSIYGSWGTALVLVFIAICHLFCSKKNVCSLLSRFQSSSVAADRHISNISPSCERPPQLRSISLSFLFWLLSIIIYQFLYCLDDCILLNMFSLYSWASRVSNL